MTIARLLVLVVVLLLLPAGCGTNPVTGKQELNLVSQDDEIDIGKKNYVPTQQAEGGPYSVDKELTSYVSAIGQRLAKASDRPDLPYEFVVLNNSVPNAWALPGGKIAVNRGLLTELKNEAELAAVLGHEIVHAAARHGAKSMERGLLLTAGVIGVGIATSGDENAGLIVGASNLGTQLVAQKYGRDAELEADRYGMIYMSRAGYDPSAAVSLQETFVRLAEGRSAGWLEGLFASHPPSKDRVEANRKMAKDIGKKGELGAAEYQARIGVLVKDQAAYKKYDAGRKALGDKKPVQALKLAQEAQAIEPREGLFYGLEGEALFQQNKFSDAEKAMDKAIERNDDYFLFYLLRGMAREKLQNNAAAKSDLTKSNQLLPNAPAYYSLGNLALQEDNRQQAIEHYRKAASSSSSIGQRAALQLNRLGVPTPIPQ